MKLVVGLGNPGAEYEWTRHNVGYHVLDRLALLEKSLFLPARKLDLSTRETPTGLEGRPAARSFRFARLIAKDALLVKPETYMNRSGDVVAPLVQQLGIQPADLLVVYDDFDLALGRLRIRPHGGPGTHKGMRSILHKLATDRFPRLRVGIGPARTDAAHHVLSRFDEKEQVEIEISVTEATEAILDWLATGDIEGCMTRFHSRWNPGAP